MMDNSEILHLLEEHDIKPTANRMTVARELSRASSPVSLSELEAIIGTIDKSNILRALILFKDNHLVHTIEGAGGCTLYELCQSHPHSEFDEDTHMYFFCESCHQTFCLSEQHIPQIELPEGYIVSTATFMVKGICPKCNRTMT